MADAPALPDEHAPAARSGGLALPEIDPIEVETEARRRRALRFLFATFLSTLLLILAITWVLDGGTKSDDPITLDGTYATIDGGQIDLVALRGTPTVLNFFASWCTPCRRELPGFQAVSQTYGDRVQFVAVNSGETDEAAARELIDDTGVTFPVALGEDGRLLERLNATVMPTTAFVAADGRVVEIKQGDLTPGELSELIESTLLSRDGDGG